MYTIASGPVTSGTFTFIFDSAFFGKNTLSQAITIGSFPSGSAQLTWEFEGLLLDMAEVIEGIPGDLTIEGHTDNVPIRTDRFYSNWDLSAARSAAVANVLVARDQVEPTRLSVTGLADTEPRVPNTSAFGN